MKKLFKTIAICVISLSTLAGCKEKKEKVLLERQKAITSFVDISLDELANKIAKDDDFLLYVYNVTCGHCVAFSPKIQEFIINTETVVYRIEGTTIGESNLVPGLKYTPSLAFYKEGKLTKLVDSTKDSEPFSSTEKLTSYIKKYAYIPKMKEIFKSQLDALIHNDDDFVVYIASSSCGDCAHFKENVLNPFLKEGKGTDNFYFIDVDKFLSRSENGVATDDWVNFKNQYGLSKTGNAEFGYGSGYVPTIQRYEDGEIVDAMVYLNDVSFENGQLVVTEGYYGNESGKVGKTYDDYTKYQDDLSSFYKSKFIEFMNK